jgi:hypothetical protein
VHRALLYSISGAFELPSDKKSAEFSKTNWGDYTLITPRGDKVIKRASVFLKTINSLKEEQWADIFKVALSFRTSSPGGKHHKAVQETEADMVSAEETESDGDELVDPRYNDDDIPNAQ